MMVRLRGYSSLLMLLFALALGGDSLVGYLCGCNIEHSEQEAGHECCSCPSHQDECGSHREQASHKCAITTLSNPLHEAIISAELLQSPEVLSREIITVLLSDKELFESHNTATSLALAPPNIIFDREWYAPCSTLRAPPYSIMN